MESREHLLAKGGTTASEKVTVGASNVTLNSYGTGNAIIDGGTAISPGSWKGPDANGVYSQPNFQSPVLEDGVYLYNSIFTAPTAPPAGQYSEYWGQATVYYHPSSGKPADHKVERVAAAGIELGLNNHVTIEGFSFTKVLYGIHSIPTSTGAVSNITITNNNFSNIEFGVWLNFYNAAATGNSITYNTFDSCFSNIEFYKSSGSTSGSHSSMTIAHNTITHSGMVNPPTYAYDWDYVDANGWDKEGIGMQDPVNCNIYNNTIIGHARGIVVYVDPKFSGNTNNFYNNFIVGSMSPIVLEPDPGAASFYSNKVYNNILVNIEGKTVGGVDDPHPPGSGIDGDEGYVLVVRNTSNPSKIYNYIYNNTLYGGRADGIAVAQQYVVENNIIYGTSNSYDTITTPNTSIIDYNLYYLGQWGGAFYANNVGLNWSQWQAKGFDAHSINGVNPTFTNGSGSIPASTPWSLSYPVPLNLLATDFQLQSSSPAIHTGVNVGLTSDYAGNPVHNPPSIGAYEFNSLSPPSGLQLQNK